MTNNNSEKSLYSNPKNKLTENNALNYCDTIEKVFQDTLVTPYFAQKVKINLAQRIQTNPEREDINPNYYIQLIEDLIQAKKTLSDVPVSKRKTLAQFLLDQQPLLEDVLDKHLNINLKRHTDLNNFTQKDTSFLQISKKFDNSYAVSLDKIISHISGQELTPATPHKWSAVYREVGIPENDNSGTQELFNIEYKGKKVAMAREEGIAKVFQKQGIEVINSIDYEKTTDKLKKTFSSYSDKFPELWKKSNWFVSDSNIFKYLFDLFSQKRIIQDIPYLGYQDENGIHKQSNMYGYLVLPYSVNGKFIYISRMRNREEATIGAGTLKNAYPVSLSLNNN